MEFNCFDRKGQGVRLATEGGGLLLSKLSDREISVIVEDTRPCLAKIGGCDLEVLYSCLPCR